MELIIGFVSGLIFSIGLIISQMIDPQKLIGFLDILGNWDYSLVFVLGGAVGFNLITFRFIQKRKSLIGKDLCLPINKAIDNKLLLGSVLFGIGWGLVGVCPGPALVNLVTLKAEVLILIAAIFIGMFGFSIFEKKKA